MQIFYILGVVLLLKQSLAENENAPTFNELTPNGKAFRAVVIAKLVTLSEEPIKLCKKLIEDAYADKSKSTNVTMALAGILRNFDRDQYKTPAATIDSFLNLGIICDVLTDRMKVFDNDMGREFLILKEALEKLDVATVANECHRKFDEFLDWLTQEYEAKHEKLTLEEQLRVTTFKELWVQFKDETDFQKQQSAYRAIYNSIIADKE